MRKRHAKKFGLINLIALILLIFVLSYVPTIVIISQKQRIIDNSALSEVSSFSGIIEIWNIDTFEGGNASKEFFLEEISRLFMKVNKGAYVHISSFSPAGLESALAEGRRPDIFSYGMGVGELIENFCQPIQRVKGIMTNFALSGEKDGVQLALPYTFGGYGIFTTSEKLAEASIDSGIDLISNYNLCGFEKTLRKKIKTVQSISYGSTDFIIPEASLFFSNGVKKTTLSTKLNPFDAYAGFVGFETSTLLLGNHRDLARLTQKLELNQISDLLFTPLGGYTDLVQYFSLARRDSIENGVAEEKFNCCKRFVEFALGDDQQLKLRDIGMFSVKGIGLYHDIPFYSAFESALTSQTIVPGAFESKVQRSERKQNYI